MGSNTSTVAGILKRVYGDMIAQQQNLKHLTIDKFAKSRKQYNPSGEGFFGAISDYGNESIGAINETEQFRTVDNENYVQYKVIPKNLVAPVEYSGRLARAAEGNEESFAAAVVDAIDNARERLLKDENRQFFGLGTGLLASPSANVASNLTSFTVDSAQYLRKNMVIDIFSGATKTVTAARIQDVDKQSNVVYFSVSVGSALVTTDQMVKQNIRDSAPTDGKEMIGLRGIVDDGTDLTTFQNIDASANRIWRGVNIAAGSANLTSDLLQRLLDDTQTLGGNEPDLIVMHPKQRRKYLDILVPEKRYLDQKLDAGHDKSSLMFNGKELLLDVDCQDSVVYALSKANIMKFEMSPMAMGSEDGSDVFLRLANFDVFQAYWRHYCNFGTDKRNAHGKITGLSKPLGIS